MTNQLTEGGAPTEAIEAMVLGEIRELLDRRSVSLDDDFFEIGGDSLDALELVEQIEAHTGPVPALSAVFTMRSIREIVNAVQDASL